ncbi:hypothetical protein EDD22DRAFT_961273 [Suillus occidentalis]|nr:hypothetical protein EDD22DRAFT_961273 [Suillus occidentalis]
MPCAGSQGGCGHRHSTSGAQLGIDEHGLGSIPPFQLIPSQLTNQTSRSDIATECRIAANTMIHTEGSLIDTLQHHQSRHQSAQLPPQERLRPYMVPLSHTSSQRTSSRVSVSLMSLDNLNTDNGSHSSHARRGSKQGVISPSKIKYYTEEDQDNIHLAWKLIVLKMLLKIGWEDDNSIWETAAKECLASASSRNGHMTEPNDKILKLILGELSNIQGKLVQEAEGCLPALGLQPDDNESIDEELAHILAHANIILDETNLRDYFLHGWDTECQKILVFSAKVFLDFHQAFWFGQNLPFINDAASRARISKPLWFMYKLLGAALNCVIHCATTGWLSKSKKVLQFLTQEFQPVAAGIQKAIQQYINNPALDDGEFLPHMTAHHEQCLKALRSRIGEASPMKKYKVYVPSSSSELYQSRTSTSMSTLSSNIVPSLSPQLTFASSSASSSNVSWYPQYDAPNIPQPEVPCYYGDGSQPQYYIPPETQPHGKSKVSGDCHDSQLEGYFALGSSAGWGASGDSKGY